jgi:hypothetical protein
MGNLEIRLTDDDVAEEKNVQVKGAGAILEA